MEWRCGSVARAWELLDSELMLPSHGAVAAGLRGMMQEEGEEDPTMRRGTRTKFEQPSDDRM